MRAKDFSVISGDEPELYLTPIPFDDFTAIQEKFAFIGQHRRSAYCGTMIFPALGGYVILADVHFVGSCGCELVWI
jgi:hypothetical protein